MWDLVKGFGEIKQYHVGLAFIIQALGVIDSKQELCFAGPSFPKSMFSVSQDTTQVKMAGDS